MSILECYGSSAATSCEEARERSQCQIKSSECAEVAADREAVVDGERFISSIRIPCRLAEEFCQLLGLLIDVVARQNPLPSLCSPMRDLGHRRLDALAHRGPLSISAI